LSFAAFGAIWVFRPDQSLALPNALLWSGALAIGALALDFLQSLYGTIAWGAFHRRKEKSGVDHETEFKAPREINWPTNACFTAKVLSLAGCYVLLLRYVFQQMA
jgi:hypothetical protein